MMIEGGTPIQLTFSNSTEFSPAWSPDGKRIAFGSNEGGSRKVWIIDADGGDRRQFARTQVDDWDDFNVTWSPGRQILYQPPGERNINVLDPETGEQRPLLRNDSVGRQVAPTYSPDGEKVAVFAGRPPGLSVISMVDNSETSYERLCNPVGWSPDGRSIYASIGNKMLSIPVNPSGRSAPRTIFTAPGDIGAASVSSDGRKFVLRVMEAKSDVWVVENFDPAYRR
jgi:Tol biopolymer transport system component